MINYEIQIYLGNQIIHLLITIDETQKFSSIGKVNSTHGHYYFPIYIKTFMCILLTYMFIYICVIYIFIG